jgi:hypothetical protein
MSSDDDAGQTKCWISSAGHIWMEGYFDPLPPAIRRRLRSSPFNLCAACLVTKFAPQVRSRHPGCSDEKALLRAIEVMEAELRSGSNKRGG